MNASGVWKGCINGRVGHFKFINVEVMPEQKGKALNKLDRTRNTCPSTVDELLNRIGLKEYTSVFVLNGYVTFLILSANLRLRVGRFYKSHDLTTAWISDYPSH
jgi:hypothetical protein